MIGFQLCLAQALECSACGRTRGTRLPEHCLPRCLVDGAWKIDWEATLEIFEACPMCRILGLDDSAQQDVVTALLEMGWERRERGRVQVVESGAAEGALPFDWC